MTHNGARFFLSIVDECSRFTWIIVLKHKFKVASIIEFFLNLVGNQFSAKIQILRRDSGIEFVNQHCTKLFNSRGILHHRSCTYIPQQNGVVERKHRHLLEVTRAIMFQSKAPINLWGDAVMQEAAIINVLPSKLLGWKCIMELFTGKKPDYIKLHVCGALCFHKLLSPDQKLEPRAHKSLFLGFS